MKHVSYPSIGKYEVMIQKISEMVSYVGKDEDGNAIYNNPSKYPTIKIKGTVKLHGTNAGIGRNSTEIWAQSRDRLIVVGNDNAGFAGYLETKKQFYMDLIDGIAIENNIDLNVYNIHIYGEWAGRGVPGGTAGIRLFPKALYLFGIKVSKPNDESFKNYWLDSSGIRSHENGLYNIKDFPIFELEVDVKKAKFAVTQLHDLTMEVEGDCPVSRWLYTNLPKEIIEEYSKDLYEELIGEGIVWEVDFRGEKLQFKTKGDRHSPKSKVRTVKTADLEKMTKVRQIAEQVTPGWRLEQFLNSTFDLANGGELSTKLIGPYITAVMKDVYKEESLVIAESGLTDKELNSTIGTIAREYFFEQLHETLPG